ncbi:unnamed protein product [Sphagnum troendelagicum]|uniref:RING-type E3 ubiquitin transferase n=1 Tax=Sphagnum troendelagicum TaxID=128251 RepID=A0ABP0TD27_9BRYO
MDPAITLSNCIQLIHKCVVVGDRARTARSSCQRLVSRLKPLKPLLEEIRESKLLPFSGAIAGFASLENGLAKAKELLELCGGNGSHLYTVTILHCKIIRVRSSTLMLSSHTDIQLELITRELKRTKYHVDASDECLAEEIEVILREQTQGLKIAPEVLQKVADKLDLGSSEAVAQEISVLEKERKHAQSEDSSLNVELLDQLLTLAEQMKEVLKDRLPSGLNIPTDFRCPLSLELMSDPVIVASGQTYERAYIQKWIDQGNTRCPKTFQTLSHKNLIPNYTVKALIANWCEANRMPLPVPVRLESVVSTQQQPLTSPGISRAEPDFNDESTTHDVDLSSGLADRAKGQPRVLRSNFRKSSGSGELETVTSSTLGENQGEPSQAATTAGAGSSGELEGNMHQTPLRSDRDLAHSDSGPHQQTASGSSVTSSIDDGNGATTADAGALLVDVTHTANGEHNKSGNLSGELDRSVSRSPRVGFSEEPGSPALSLEKTIFRRRGEERDASLPRIVPDTSGTEGNAQQLVNGLVEDLQSSAVDVQRAATAELRLLAKYNMENRITIANAGAIKPLVALLRSSDQKTQENAVTALLNLSINDNNKAEIAAAGAIEPLVDVLRIGNSEAMENAAATLFSLSVMDDNKVIIGASGAIPPLVHLLINGTPRGKKDAATALFNLSIFHENKGRIVQAGAIKPLVELMAEPAAGMVDKAVAVLANLATILDGRQAIGDEHGIPALVEVVEAGSQRGKENAAAALLQLCMNSNRHRAQVLQEGAIPPLVALSQSGTARAKEKASALLRHFREQRHGGLGGRSNPDRHLAGHY